MEQVQTYEQALDKVINFWAEKSFNTALNQNNGDNSIHGGTMFMLANLISQKGQQEATPHKIEVFKERLKYHILNHKYSSHFKFMLSVDYDCNMALALACEDAGLSTACVPIKTQTWIDRVTFEASASYQYGGEKQIL